MRTFLTVLAELYEAEQNRLRGARPLLLRISAAQWLVYKDMLGASTYVPCAECPHPSYRGATLRIEGVNDGN